MITRVPTRRWRASLTIILVATLAACGGNSAQPSTSRVSSLDTDAAAGPAAKADSSSTTAPETAVLSESVEADRRPLRIMPLGDSLTRGDGPADPTRPQSYRGFLVQSLAAEGYQLDFVGSDTTPTAGDVDPDNEGHGGFTIGPDASKFCATCPPANLADGLDGWLADNPADVVLLLAGTNDLLPVNTPTAEGLIRPVDPAEAGSKLQALIDQIRAAEPEVTVLVASLPPMPFAAGDPVLNQALTALNSAAAGAAAGSGGKVVYVPMYEKLLPQWSSLVDNQSDGLHPTPAGAAKIAKVWHDALLPVLDQLGG